MMPDDRKHLRSSIRQQRRALPESIRQIASQRIVSSMSNLKSFESAHKIAGFLAFDGEADPLELMRLAHQQQKQVYVPIMVGKAESLKFCPWQPDVPMKINHFGIEEPAIDPVQWISGEQLDFVICPLVAFDQSCRRMGVGAGYYDRTFAFLNECKPSHRRHVDPATVLAGFAFEMQKVREIVPQPWDVALDWVVTERQLYRRYR